MAETFWFIPVAGGGTGGGQFLHTPDLDSVKVYWGFSTFPVTAGEPSVAYRLVKSESFNSGAGAGTVGAAYANWSWISYSDCDDGIATGGQLVMGTTFGTRYPTNNASAMSQTFSTAYDRVTGFAKFKVNETDRFSGIYLSINNTGANSSSSSELKSALSLADDTWRLATTGDINFGGWSNVDNLRIVLTFQGTTTAANVGLTEVSVEWFAIRLWHT
jgi:hypothetical protein